MSATSKTKNHSRLVDAHKKHMLQTDWNGRALGQKTQGIGLVSFNVPQDDAPEVYIPCTGVSNQVRLPDCSQQEYVRPANEQLQGLRKRLFGRAQQLSSRHDKNKGLPLWLPCRVAVNSGHPLEIVLIGCLGLLGVRHTFKVEDALASVRIAKSLERILSRMDHKVPI